MYRRRPTGVRACRPGLEPLEERSVPAQFGVPWHDSTHLTISFVPDGTAIADRPSELFRTLDARQPRADWQREVLEAFQAWAVNARINVALKPDAGDPLGTPGPDQGDPRFGDIRIGAVPMSPEVLSISVPHDPFLSGTWSGDILLNSAADSAGAPADVLPILLHEVGHVLGIDHSDDPRSVMFEHLDNRLADLAPSDVAAVQALYGARPADPFEGPAGNNTFATATPLPAPAGYDGATPLFLYANISTPRDVDVFTLSPPAGYDGPATVRLQSSGVSLLAPRLTVTDADGRPLADVSSVAQGGDTLEVHLPHVVAGATYSVEVRGATPDLFGMGEYVLAATFDDRSTVGADAIDRLARQSYSYLSPDDLRAIFLDPVGALFHRDVHANDTFATAEPLEPIGAYGSEAPDRITASLGDPSDVDVYRIETPDVHESGSHRRPLVMTATGRATEVNGLMPRVSVFDAQLRPVPALVLAHGDGTFTVQVTGASADADYYIRVSSDPTSGKVVGNYHLDIEFGHVAADPSEFVRSTLEADDDRATYDLEVRQSQLFDLLLAASGGSAGAGVRMVLTDADGRVLATRAAGVGDTAGGDPVLLAPGTYRATFTRQGPAGALPSPVAFRLYGASLSDPIGPALDDPTLNPVSDPASLDPNATIPPALGAVGSPYTWVAVALAVPGLEEAGIAARATEGRDAASAGGTFVRQGAPTSPRLAASGDRATPALGPIVSAQDGRPTSTSTAASPAAAGRLAGPTGSTSSAGQAPADRRGGTAAGSSTTDPDRLAPASADPTPSPTSPSPLLADLDPSVTPVASRPRDEPPRAPAPGQGPDVVEASLTEDAEETGGHDSPEVTAVLDDDPPPVAEARSADSPAPDIQEASAFDPAPAVVMLGVAAVFCHARRRRSTPSPAGSGRSQCGMRNAECGMTEDAE